MKYSSIVIIATATAAKLMATSGAPTRKEDVLLDTDQSRLLGKGGKKDNKGLKRQMHQLEAKVVELTNNLQECNDECNELRPTSIDYSLEKYGDEYCQYLAEESNGDTLEVCNHMCPIAARNGWLLPGNCDATGKCVAACRYEPSEVCESGYNSNGDEICVVCEKEGEGEICGQGQEWRDSQLIANAGFCQLGECQDVECEPIDISDASQCCQNSPYCTPENDGVGTMPLKYKCEATRPVCLAPGALCRKDYLYGDTDSGQVYGEVLPPTSEGDCCGLYCSVVTKTNGTPKLKPSTEKGVTWTAEYTCQEEKVLPYWSSYPPLFEQSWLVRCIGLVLWSC